MEQDNTYAPLTPVRAAAARFRTSDAFRALVLARHRLAGRAGGRAARAGAVAAVCAADGDRHQHGDRRRAAGAGGHSRHGHGTGSDVVAQASANALAKQSFSLSMPLVWTVIFGALATLLAVSGRLSFVRRFLRTWGIWLLLVGAGLPDVESAGEARYRRTDVASGHGRNGVRRGHRSGRCDAAFVALIADYTRLGRSAGGHVSRDTAGPMALRICGSMGWARCRAGSRQAAMRCRPSHLRTGRRRDRAAAHPDRRD